jgi:hypothetical protein
MVPQLKAVARISAVPPLETVAPLVDSFNKYLFRETCKPCFFHCNFPVNFPDPLWTLQTRLDQPATFLHNYFHNTNFCFSLCEKRMLSEIFCLTEFV